jgi:putative alpha-1,2-mannosidase
MKTDAEVVPCSNFDPQDLTGSTKEGRGALPDWLEYGFIMPNFSRSISRTVEYSLNDFSLYQVAQEIMPGDAATYLNRSAYAPHYLILSDTVLANLGVGNEFGPTT